MHVSKDFAVRWSNGARKGIGKIDEHKKQAIHRKIELLRTKPALVNVKKLESTKFYCIKIAEYRVIFEIVPSENIVYIHAAGHRKDVYRALQTLKSVRKK